MQHYDLNNEKPIIFGTDPDLVLVNIVRFCVLILYLVIFKPFSNL